MRSRYFICRRQNVSYTEPALSPAETCRVKACQTGRSQARVPGVAAALGTPLIAIFGPTEPRRTGPYGHLESVVQAGLPCIPCMKPRCTYPKPLECLRAISPELILARLGTRWKADL